ncbi:fusaric acid resistance family protein [Microbacterium sp. AG157]|uniref:FUSC family protein n=1 Tax=Microbacterium TaxID=33882 RepID=UPI000CCF0497|nr:MULTISPECIES: FUSC family protein [Microbacterium]PNW10779.1 FUSC family protein [Microbacterium testaceum]REC98187.1 fusaric acid resistance family protein [Microbacterium sp. AG157]
MAESRGRVWTGVIRVGPHRGDHRVALRAVLSVGVPLLVLLALGRLDLSVYASFGAFAALYGRTDLPRARVRMQAVAGTVLVSCMLIGTALSTLATPAIASVAVVAILAAVVTLFAYRTQWHPPGALFAVFAAGATASFPATGATFLTVLVVGGASVLWSLLVTCVFVVARRGSWRRPTRTRPPIGSVAWEMTATVGVAALLAGVAGALLIGTHWYWAMVGAVAAVGGAHVTARLIRGVQRLVGTLLGVLIAAGLLALDLPPWIVLLVAVALQAGAELFVGRNYGIAMLFITPLALLMVSLASPVAPEMLLRDRVIETVIGVAVGTLVAIVSAGLRRRPARS